VEHRDNGVGQFFLDYLRTGQRKPVGLVAAAGFDARSCVMTELLARASKDIDAIFIREERPAPDASLVERAHKNVATLQSALPRNQTISVEVFGEGSAVVGGRTVASKLRSLYEPLIKGWTDVFIDATAFSVGIGFPLIKFFLEQSARGTPRNVHVLIAADSATDDAVAPIASDSMTIVHGFGAGLSLYEAGQVAKLWLPQLAPKRAPMLDTIYRAINPDDVCPILPFPARRPRVSDELIRQYMTEFESTWEVDARDIVYSAENDPKDLYRTLVRMHKLWRSVFQDIGGSTLILSPLGSKAMALGALMAAYELNLAVTYVESEGFDSATVPSAPVDSLELIHLWLAGDVYPDEPPIARPA